MKRLLMLAAAVALAGAGQAADHSSMNMPLTGGVMKMIDPMPGVYMGQADKPGAPIFKGLGTHRHPITTKVAKTQLYFDQGINLLFGFNHAEAIRSFREAARLDRRCAMCWWGVAFALGPNINLPMPGDAVAPAWDALQNARALERHASPEEREWIEALAARYAPEKVADRAKLDEAFAAAMGKVWHKHPGDLDAGTFYAEAMMDTQPWDYWQMDGQTPKGHGAEIVSTLESILARSPDHPGALHLYIHAVEASTIPERAEAAADRLSTLMPGAGHIVHMPSHIYYRVGRYQDAVRVNEDAAKVDEQYIAACRAQGYYPLGYYAHNIHFLWTSSEMLGRYQAALDASRRLIKAMGPDASALGDSGQLYFFTPIATYLRFGRWDEVLAEPLPSEKLKLDLVMAHLARGFAYANKGDLKSAQSEREALGVLANDPALPHMHLPARSMATLALAELDGEIARKSGELSAAISDFTKAAAIEHSLPYTEPPYWHQPVSHLLGAALLEAGRNREAETVYRESLQSYRVDGWALNGLAMALEAQGKSDEAHTARDEFKTAWQLADVALTSSRF